MENAAQGRRGWKMQEWKKTGKDKYGKPYVK